MFFTKKQLDILRFLRDFRNEHAVSPTLEEVAESFSVSKVTIFEHLRKLEEKGAIRRRKAYARGIEILHDPDLPEERGLPAESLEFPVLGRIRAGSPLEAIEDRETISLSELIPHGHNHYLLRVVGDSMIEDHIQDGDFVIVEKRAVANNGEMVVGVLEDNEATLKRFYREKGRFRLQPSNPNYPPIYTETLEIRGVVVGVIRQIR